MDLKQSPCFQDHDVSRGIIVAGAQFLPGLCLCYDSLRCYVPEDRGRHLFGIKCVLSRPSKRDLKLCNRHFSLLAIEQSERYVFGGAWYCRRRRSDCEIFKKYSPKYKVN